MFSSGPPELPGLMAVSVWIMSLRATPFSSSSERPVADTMPVVTVGPPERSKALPMATS